jgi:signal transduction histidine kinase
MKAMAGKAMKQVLGADHLNRRSWLLWGVTTCVVLALTGALSLIYLPLLAAEGTLGEELQASYTTLISLSGLIVIFCLYSALKQGELSGMRRALEAKEQEKEVVRSRLSELSALFQVTTALNLQLRLDVILEIIVRRVVSALKAQQASIMLYDAETGVLETRASYGLESEFARHAKKKLGEGIAGWVAQQNQPLLLSERPPGELGQHYKPDRNITSALSLPLRVGMRCIGVLNVNRINFPVSFEDHHRELLMMFAEHVGAAVDRAQAVEKLGTRARALEEDNQRLSEVNRLKDVFLSTATHELKTPLTSVIAYSELLSDPRMPAGDPQRAEFVTRLRGEAHRLLGLIDDILDLSRIESGKLVLHRRTTSLTTLAAETAETTRPLADKYSVTIETELGKGVPEMPLDEVKMRQVFLNLLVNAVKFSSRGGTVTMRVRIDDDDVLIEVVDRGAGIHPEEATYIFEMFGQGANAIDQAKGGLGIGLHLVKRLSELHGGHVGVNSRPREGSTFWVRLPLAISEIPESPDASAAAA